jgi:hypothetical protein
VDPAPAVLFAELLKGYACVDNLLISSDIILDGLVRVEIVSGRSKSPTQGRN